MSDVVEGKHRNQIKSNHQMLPDLQRSRDSEAVCAVCVCECVCVCVCVCARGGVCVYVHVSSVSLFATPL